MNDGKMLVDKLVISPEYFQGASSSSMQVDSSKVKQHSMSP
jgi:hypothetical protein